MGARAGRSVATGGGFGSKARKNTFVTISGRQYGNITINKKKSIEQVQKQVNKLLKNMKNRPGGLEGKYKSMKTLKAGKKAMDMAAKYMRYS